MTSLRRRKPMACKSLMNGWLEKELERLLLLLPPERRLLSLIHLLTLIESETSMSRSVSPRRGKTPQWVKFFAREGVPWLERLEASRKPQLHSLIRYR